MRLYWKNEWTVPSVVGVVSFGVGVGVGYIVASRYKRLEKTLEEMKSSADGFQLQFKLDDRDRSRNINEALEHAWRIITKVDGRDEQEIISEENSKVADSVWASLNEKAFHPSMPGFEPESESVFPENEDENWDYEEELKHRTPHIPYIIHRDEYDEGQEGYSQSTLTYYKGDDVLCDELDVPIYNADKVVGKLEFGKGSNDPSIVYVRNERLEADYEILLEHGHFQVVVLGEQIEQSFESEKSPPPKFRMD